MTYDMLYSLLSQRVSEQPGEFSEVIDLINREQADPGFCELVNYLSQEEVQYITYSHA